MSGFQTTKGSLLIVLGIVPLHWVDKEVRSFLDPSSSCILHSLPCPQQECIDAPEQRENGFLSHRRNWSEKGEEASFQELLWGTTPQEASFCELLWGISAPLPESEVVPPWSLAHSTGDPSVSNKFSGIFYSFKTQIISNTFKSVSNKFSGISNTFEFPKANHTFVWLFLAQKSPKKLF